MNLSEYDHESFRALLGTVASGTIILVLMTLLLFAVPFALFLLL
jgi:hypothetical protein